MNRISVLSIAIVLIGAMGFLATTAQSQLGAPKSAVTLQPTTPGTSQSGHANVSGTMRAGQFVGGGAGLTNLSASNIATGTLDPNRLGVPLSLSGNVGGNGATFTGTNASTGNLSSGILGVSTGLGAGVRGSSPAVGVLGTSPSGYGVEGYVTATSGQNFGVLGQTDSTSGYGVFGIANNSTGTNYGVFGRSISTSGYGGFFTGVGPDTVLIQNTGSGRGLQVNAPADTALWANTTSGLAALDARNAKVAGYGVLSTASGANGFGVAGLATAITGTGIGVYGRSDAPSGKGVYGDCGTANDGSGGWFQSNAISGYGVVGYAYNATGFSIGVVGQANSPSGWAVFGYGNTGATGTKSFRIDHPLDPENKYLLHYSTEAPEPQNAYNGVVATGANGYAWVELPNYFGEINRDFRYQLTVIDSSDDFVIAKVTREIADNRFQIRTNKPGVKVSWEVKAIRNDAWVRRYGAPVEIEKPESEKGKYQRPELYGQPAERGILVRQVVKSPQK